MSDRAVYQDLRGKLRGSARRWIARAPEVLMMLVFSDFQRIV